MDLNASNILYNKTLIANEEDKAGVLIALECLGEMVPVRDVDASKGLEMV